MTSTEKAGPLSYLPTSLRALKRGSRVVLHPHTVQLQGTESHGTLAVDVSPRRSAAEDRDRAASEPGTCSECLHKHRDLLIVDDFPDTVQEGFPNGERMCIWCLGSNYNSDPGNEF